MENFYKEIKKEIGISLEGLAEQYLKENILEKPEFQGRIFYVKVKDYIKSKISRKKKFSEIEEKIKEKIEKVPKRNKEKYFKELFLEAIRNNWYLKIPHKYEGSALEGNIGKFINEEFFRVKIFQKDYKDMIKEYLKETN